MTFRKFKATAPLGRFGEIVKAADRCLYHFNEDRFIGFEPIGVTLTNMSAARTEQGTAVEIEVDDDPSRLAFGSKPVSFVGLDDLAWKEVAA